MQAIYGFEDDITLDYFVKLNEVLFDAVVDLFIPGKYWVDFLPWLKYIPSWVPGATFKKRAEQFKKASLATIEEAIQISRSNALVSAPFSFTMKRSLYACPLLKDGKNVHSFNSIFPNALIDTPQHELTILRDAAANAYIGLNQLIRVT